MSVRGWLMCTAGVALAASIAAGASACGGVQLGTRPVTAAALPGEPRASPGPRIDPVEFYRGQGLLAHGPPLPFTGSVAYFATGRSDSTTVVVALAMGADALSFRRDGDEYRAEYRVTVHLRRDAEIIARAEATEVVRVATLRETSRADESILFQQLLVASPGALSLSVEVRDLASGRAAAYARAISVPQFPPTALATPAPIYGHIARTMMAEVPRVLLNPRALATAGRDSTIDLYVETYGQAGRQVLNLVLRVEGEAVWSGMIAAEQAVDLATAVVRVPVEPVTFGAAEVVVWLAGTSDSARTPVFVGFGEDLPATTFADMLNYLEFFTSEARLQSLRASAPRDRAARWRNMMSATDPVPGTPENEALRTYFARMRQANAAFAEVGLEGWRTDRGMVLLVLGEPDRVLDQFTGDATLHGRVQQWEYNSLNLIIVFEDVGGRNRWRLTRASEAALAAERARRQGRP